MKKILAISLLLLTGLNGFGQEEINPTELKTIFKNMYLGKYNGFVKKAWSDGYQDSYKREYNSWNICNSDSSYSTRDTIIAWNYQYASQKNNCSLIRSWNLIGKSKINYVDSYGHIGAVYPNSFDVKFEQKNGSFFIGLYSNGVCKEKFKVLELTKNDGEPKVDNRPYLILTLLRVQV